jgi:ABC-type sugar transport system ATPase subunit
MTGATIRFDHVTKRFPGVVALEDVSFEVAPGTCHALCGENGAGKSTLGKMLAGIHSADTGTIAIDGHAVRFGSPAQALDAGVAMVHQELSFCANLSVADNLSLGTLPSRGGFVATADLHQQARSLLAGIDPDIDVTRPLGSLTIGQQQMVQIAAAIGRGARVIVFDEPTSSLSQHEVDRLYALMDRLKAGGVTCIYVSHRLEEIFRLCDAVTILRDGHHVATTPIGDLDQHRLVELMIGRRLEEYFPAHAKAEPREELLRVEGLSSPAGFSDITFQVRAGEVVGFAGLVGAGRSEVARAVFGLDPDVRGRVFVRGRPLLTRSVRAAIDAGIGLVPEDRKHQGLVLSMSVLANATLSLLDRATRFGLLSGAAERKLARPYLDRLRVRAPSLDTPVAALSGGNQQKVVLTRWLASECPVLIVDEPTRGVDVGAKAEIHALIDALAAGGAAIVLISSEMPEILHLSTRVLVFRQGRIAGELPRAQATQAALMNLMAGVIASSSAK